MNSSLHNFIMPPTNELLTPEAKAEILQMKLSSFRKSFTRELIEGGDIEHFIQGDSAVNTQYDCEPIFRFGLVSSRKSAVMQIAHSAVDALDDAAERAGFEAPNDDRILLDAEMLEDDATVRVELRYLEN